MLFRSIETVTVSNESAPHGGQLECKSTGINHSELEPVTVSICHLRRPDNAVGLSLTTMTTTLSLVFHHTLHLPTSKPSALSKPTPSSATVQLHYVNSFPRILSTSDSPAKLTNSRPITPFLPVFQVTVCLHSVVITLLIISNT